MGQSANFRNSCNRPKMISILIGFVLIQGLSAQQCFDLGQCKDSILLGAVTATSTNECLGLCKEIDGCEYLTYDHTNGFCGLYLDCASIGTEQCEQCITGPVTCEYIQCNIPGQCVGIFEYQQTAQTQTDCEADCIEYGDKCVWYTYNNADLLCTMFSECQSFSDALCSDCVSGQPACILEGDLPPATDPPTTNTTIATTVLPTTITTTAPPTTITTTAPPTTTTQYPPDCEYTGQTLPYPESCRKYYECLADSTWMVFDCCPGVYDPTSDACVSEEVGGDLCDEDDEGCI